MEDATPRVILLLIPHCQGFLFYFYLSIYFSYNWPAQSDAVDYGDADEVNKTSETFTVCIAYCIIYSE